jgi:hypothetical protein
MKHIKTEEFQIKFPFVSCIRCGNEEYVGIIINHDTLVTSMYDISVIKSESDRQKLLDLGDTWWWESNRKIPISIFLKSDMIVFRPIIKTFNSKDVTIIFGPVVNLSEISEKRVKRKSIQLIRAPSKSR